MIERVDLFITGRFTWRRTDDINCGHSPRQIIYNATSLTGNIITAVNDLPGTSLESF